MRSTLLACLLLLAIHMAGCATPPELLGHPVNTPGYYSEDKMFFLEQLPTSSRHTQRNVKLVHVHQVALNHPTPKNLWLKGTLPRVDRSADAINHGDPVAVILKGVRIPEDLPGGKRDIAVVLDINMSVDKGVEPLVAFYQRDVPPGQMLNFSNLVVFAEYPWDSSTPPYFRVRVLDVKAERNRRTEAMLRNASELSGEIAGLVPHPIIPIVTQAIDAATMVLGHRSNVVLLDFQVQLYGIKQVASAGDAALGPLLAGQWLIMGRRNGADSSFWASPLALDRETDRIVSTTTPNENIPVPYISIAIMRANLEVPKLVMERSQELIKLLSSPTGKSDIDQMDAAAESLTAEIRAFTVARRLSKYRSRLDLKEIVELLGHHADAEDKGTPILSKHGARRLLHVVGQATGFESLTTPREVANWWAKGGDRGRFESRPDSPLGVIWVVPPLLGPV